MTTNMIQLAADIRTEVDRIARASQSIAALTSFMEDSSPVTPPTNQQRLALCIGLNYPGTSNALRGCINDMNRWSSVFQSRGFSVTLNPEPNKTQLVESIRGICNAAKSGDVVAIQYSGHGTQVPDRNGDEVDGYDEAWCPSDVSSGKLLVDDELGEILSSTPATVYVFSDSCHSGTMGRDGSVDPASVRYLPPDKIPGVTSCMMDTMADMFRPLYTSERPAVGDNVAWFSGCQDNEFSADAYIGGKFQGAFSHYCCTVLEQREDLTNAELAAKVRNSLPWNKYRQTPGIVATPLVAAKKLFT